MNRFHFKILLFSFIFFSTLPFSTNAGQVNTGYEKRFEKILVEVIERTLQVAPRRPYKIKSFNDSLSETALAGKDFLDHSVGRETHDHIQSALRESSDNHLAMLMNGLYLDLGGDSSQANKVFEEFLKSSQLVSSIDKKVMDTFHYHELRRGVFVLLESRGIKAEPFLTPPTWFKRNSFQALPKILNFLILFFVVGCVLVVLEKLWREVKPLPEGAKRCPHCRAPVLLLVVECPECKTKLDGSS